MKEIAISEILCGVCDKLHRRKIRKTNGYEFTAKDMSRLIKYFQKDSAVQSVNYDAIIQIDGSCYNGYITIWSDGSLNVQLKHDNIWGEGR